MARRLVEFTEGSYYHIYNCGAGKRHLYADNPTFIKDFFGSSKDYEEFVQGFAATKKLQEQMKEYFLD